MYNMRRLPRLMTEAQPRIAVWRGGQTTYVDGKPTQRNPLQFFARALVVPISSQKQMMMPEGNRLSERYTIYQAWRDTVPVNAPEDYVDQDGRFKLMVNDKCILTDSQNAFIVEEAKFWGEYVEATAVRIDVGKTPPPDFPEVPA